MVGTPNLQYLMKSPLWPTCSKRIAFPRCHVFDLKCTPGQPAPDLAAPLVQCWGPRAALWGLINSAQRQKKAPAPVPAPGLLLLLLHFLASVLPILYAATHLHLFPFLHPSSVYSSLSGKCLERRGEKELMLLSSLKEKKDQRVGIRGFPKIQETCI